LHSPAGSPRVLDEPVLRTRVNTPANSQDTVVKSAGRASRLIVDTRGVKLEGRVAGINGNGSWSRVDLLLEIGFGSRLDIGVALQGGTSVSDAVLAAGTILGGIRVGRFNINSSVLNDVVHGTGHKTTITTLVTIAVRTIHQVLLRESNEGVARDKVATFSGSSGGERPATSTLALVLHSSDSTLGSPVKRVWETNVGVSRLVLDSRALHNHVHASIDASELLSGEVGKLVDGNSE